MENIEINNSIYKIINNNELDSIFITFIIPTIGRESLIDTIESLYKLKIEDWKAILIFDGFKDDSLYKQIIEIDIYKKIKIINTDIKIGNISKRNSAGLVRNIGIKSIDFKTEWVGFVDDDDTISPYYINNLKDELLIRSNIEVCIFRMMYENGCVLPTKYDRNILKNRVGISFALKYDIIQEYLFINNPFEDYLYLKNLQNEGFKILISSFVCYFVRFIYDQEHPFIKKSLIKDYEYSIEYPKIYIN
jgi:cellulose synthase/poly-beta-1,6-N-acetylglucosamine synthase-like glycosyltransferase